MCAVLCCHSRSVSEQSVNPCVARRYVNRVYLCRVLLLAFVSRILFSSILFSVDSALSFCLFHEVVVVVVVVAWTFYLFICWLETKKPKQKKKNTKKKTIYINNNNIVDAEKLSTRIERRRRETQRHSTLKFVFYTHTYDSFDRLAWMLIAADLTFASLLLLSLFLVNRYLVGRSFIRSFVSCLYARDPTSSAEIRTRTLTTTENTAKKQSLACVGTRREREIERKGDRLWQCWLDRSSIDTKHNIQSNSQTFALHWGYETVFVWNEINEETNEWTANTRE